MKVDIGGPGERWHWELRRAHGAGDSEGRRAGMEAQLLFPCWFLNVPWDEKLQNWGEKICLERWNWDQGGGVCHSVRATFRHCWPGLCSGSSRPLCFMLGSFPSTCREPGEPGSILSALWEQQHRGHKSLSCYSQVFLVLFIKNWWCGLKILRC